MDCNAFLSQKNPSTTILDISGQLQQNHYKVKMFFFLCFFLSQIIIKLCNFNQHRTSCIIVYPFILNIILVLYMNGVFSILIHSIFSSTLLSVRLSFVEIHPSLLLFFNMHSCYRHLLSIANAQYVPVTAMLMCHQQIAFTKILVCVCECLTQFRFLFIISSEKSKSLCIFSIT